MSFSFPTKVSLAQVANYRLIHWKNTMNQFDVLRFEIKIPDFLALKHAVIEGPKANYPIVDLSYHINQERKIEFIVQATYHNHELAMSDFLEYTAKISGEKTEHVRLINSDVNRPDVLVSKVFSDNSKWVTRRRAIKFWVDGGAIVVIVNLACESSTYEKYANLFCYVCDSFKMELDADYYLAERLVFFSKRYPKDFGTYLPESWYSSQNKSDTHIRTETIFRKKIADKVTGILKIASENHNIIDTNVNQVALYELSQLNIPGVNPSKINFKSGPPMDGAVTVKAEHEFSFIYQEERKNAYIELYLFVFSKNYIFICVAGVSAKDNFEANAVNRRAIALAVENLKIA